MLDYLFGVNLLKTSWLSFVRTKGVLSSSVMYWFCQGVQETSTSPRHTDHCPGTRWSASQRETKEERFRLVLRICRWRSGEDGHHTNCEHNKRCHNKRWTLAEKDVSCSESSLNLQQHVFFCSDFLQHLLFPTFLKYLLWWDCWEGIMTEMWPNLLVHQQVDDILFKSLTVWNG